MLAGADEALGELVDDVIVLGQQLAGDIERDRVGPVLADDAAKAIGDAIERRRPSVAGAPSTNRLRASRPSRSMVSASAEPLLHSRPKLAGCCLSPSTRTSARRVPRRR